ncbi:hypothetical protein BDQ12DRAFT_669633 [Crucibulum laeve]|uniref:Uncharacterized protein n=1 Tax=Crucibulum laeve TaxID=68775 RepID=A0A5C3LNK9_9AGAR|nr:hypothetical protein BDQ12DRAFT_669633 [Crucibulum laeve]
MWFALARQSPCLKNLIKLWTGAYIALECLKCMHKLATLSGTSGHMPCLTTTTRPRLSSSRTSSIFTIASLPMGSLASTQFLNTCFADLCEDKKVQAYEQKELKVIGKKNVFKPMGLLQSVVLTSNEWMPESGLVMAVQKVQRSKITEAFKAKINGVYRSD